jgi:hypothetical protein
VKITIIAPNQLEVTAELEKWLCGLIALLDDGQRIRLCELVAKRVELGHIAGQTIIVPSILSQEKLGNF